MRVPRTPPAWEKRKLQPIAIPFRGIRRVLIGIVIVAAWSPPPNPWPLLILLLYWLRWAWPVTMRRVVRWRILRRHFLPNDVWNSERAAVARLRRMFAMTLVVVLSHLPFFAAYAVSYPFMMSSARYWLTVAPYTDHPAPAPKLIGVFFVVRQDASLQTVNFYLPLGVIEVRVGDKVGEFKSEFFPYFPDGRRSPC